MRGSTTIRSPESSSISTRLPARPTSTTRRPTAFRRNSAMGGSIVIGRKRVRGTQTSSILDPRIDAIPRRIVSTSGNSGMAHGAAGQEAMGRSPADTADLNTWASNKQAVRFSFQMTKSGAPISLPSTQQASESTIV